MRLWKCLPVIVAMSSSAIATAQPPDGPRDRPRDRQDERGRTEDRRGPGGPGAPGGPGGPGGPRPPSPLIEVLDIDGDHEISAEEIKNAAASLTKLDRNKDGKLNDEELRPQGVGRPPEDRRDEGRRDEPRRDEPRRDEPRRDEGRRDERRPEGDRGPGDEVRRGPGPGQGPANPERMLTHAFQFDEDKDGKLSKDELQKFIEDFVRQRPGPGGPGGPGPRGPGNNEGARPGRPAGGDRPQRPERSE